MSMKDYVGIRKTLGVKMLHVIRNPELELSVWVCPSCKAVIKNYEVRCTSCMSMIPRIVSLKNNEEMRLIWHFAER